MKTKIVESQTSKQGIWEKIPNTTSLYRYRPTGNIVFRGTVNGRGINRSLETTNLTLAKREAVHLIEKEKRIVRGGGKITLLELLEELRITKAGKNQQLIKTIVNRLKGSSLGNEAIEKIRPVEIAKWMNGVSAEVSNGFNNQVVETLKAAFRHACSSKYISENPMDELKLRKKVKRIMPQAPTVEQFEAIREQIKNNKFSDTATEAWELFSFCGLFGCYEAEARVLDWSHFDWTKNRIQFQRQKTENYYMVPIFSFAESFIADLWDSRGKPFSGKVFKIDTTKRSLETACKKLGYPHFTILNFRQMHICRLIASDTKLKRIAEWVGHQDGGALILKTYAQVFSDRDDKDEKAELEKIRSAEALRTGVNSQ